MPREQAKFLSSSRLILIGSGESEELLSIGNQKPFLNEFVHYWAPWKSSQWGPWIYFNGTSESMLLLNQSWPFNESGIGWPWSMCRPESYREERKKLHKHLSPVLRRSEYMYSDHFSTIDGHFGYNAMPGKSAHSHQSSSTQPQLTGYNIAPKYARHYCGRYQNLHSAPFQWTAKQEKSEEKVRMTLGRSMLNTRAATAAVCSYQHWATTHGGNMKWLISMSSSPPPPQTGTIWRDHNLATHRPIKHALCPFNF